MPKPRFGLCLILLSALAACRPSPTPFPPPTPPVDCALPPAADALTDDWRFRTDPDDIGLSEAWFSPSWDDSDWLTLAPGEPWESHGLEYDGLAWYRTQITLPDWPVAYLGFGGVDDIATLWVNGQMIQTWEGLGARPALLNLLDHGQPGERLTLALRIDDLGEYGGIKQPLRLGSDLRTVITAQQYAIWLADAHPDWPMPPWATDRPYAWTMTGQVDAADEVLLASGGAVAPWAGAPTAEIWLYDTASGELVAASPQDSHFWLANGHLPMPQWQWQASGVTVNNTLFGEARTPATRWLLTVENNSDIRRDLRLLLVIRPFTVTPAQAPVCNIDLRGNDHLWINGQPYLVAAETPAEAGVGSLVEAMTAAARGRAPGETSLTHIPAADGAAVWAYALTLAPAESRSLAFAFPAAPGDDFPTSPPDVDAHLQESLAAWEAATSHVTIDLPDDLVEAGMRTSLGYLLLALDPDGPHPGPLAHDALWVRDAAYIGLALLQFGHADQVRDLIPAVLGAQEASGRVPPIQGENIPWDDDEWDAQGQAIFLVTAYYHYTGDEALLREWYPALRAAAQFIVDLRAGQAGAIGPARGLLPPSKSAEDIGPPDWHHYWDNFWAVAGLQEAAYAARQLGETADAAWMQAEAETLRDAILASVEAVMGPEAAYIPGAVEGVESSAMARGTVPALWPVEVLSRDLPLLARAFDHYHQLWVAPYKGGFRHRAGQFWPYGGLELAHAYLRLGRTDVLHQILGWTLSHQTLPGTFAWAEQVSPVDGGFSGGDMPHAWAAAGYATLVREMLFSESDGALHLFAGAADWWLSDGQSIVVENAPTHFGPLDLRTESTLQQSDAAWQGTLTLTLAGAEPPGGYRWQLPRQPVSIDGPVGTGIKDGWLIVPTDGIISLTFAP